MARKRDPARPMVQEIQNWLLLLLHLQHVEEIKKPNLKQKRKRKRKHPSSDR